MRPFETINLIYDGQCAFCIRSLKIVRAFDLFGALRFYDAHQWVMVKRKFPMLREADVDNAMYAVTEHGEVYRGFFAFRRLLWSSPLTWVLVPLFYLPGSSFFGTRIYAWVARNRAQFGCRSQICRLPELLDSDQPPEKLSE